ncbi:MAG: helix-turn-helix domain-containing protein [Rickettsiaceae bacterium]|nr:helix-turn-helix domain-containing protein [Rickettsiaceae bacterium]
MNKSSGDKTVSLNKTIEELMWAKGKITMSDLSRLAKVPQPTLHHIMTGETKRPGKKTLNALANFFSITINQLTGVEPLLIEKKHELKVHSVRLITWDELKNLSTMNLSEPSDKKVITEINISKQSFALISAGNKLEQLFPDGCILIFDALRQPKNRDFVIVYIEENQDILLRRIFIEGSVQYVRSPESIINDASLHKIDGKVDKIIATLVESKIRF